MKNRVLFFLAGLFATGGAASADECRIIDYGIFQPQNEHVALARGRTLDSSANYVLFQAQLRVNTDGAPTSYHPDDPRGITKAINNVVNGISIRKRGARLSYGDKIKAFEMFRDNQWVAPQGYKIVWQNVIAATERNGKMVPCTFSTGPYQGYFGSLTTLKNGLSGTSAGECQVNDQLDQRYVPGLVLPGGPNPLRKFNASIGDIALAINPETGKTVAAVVADGGPPDNLGEGSVALNMALQNQVLMPDTYQKAKLLDTGHAQMIVAIIPASKAYDPQRPFTADNITTRVTKWASEHGYQSLEGLASNMKSCANKL